MKKEWSLKTEISYLTAAIFLAVAMIGCTLPARIQNQNAPMRCYLTFNDNTELRMPFVHGEEACYKIGNALNHITDSVTGIRLNHGK